MNYSLTFHDVRGNGFRIGLNSFGLWRPLRHTLLWTFSLNDKTTQTLFAGSIMFLKEQTLSGNDSVTSKLSLLHRELNECQITPLSVYVLLVLTYTVHETISPCVSLNLSEGLL